VINENEKMIQLLLSFGADVNIKDALGCSALTYSLFNDQISLLELLLDKKPGIEFIDKVSYNSNLH
jgi:ankyrin repeat protein